MKDLFVSYELALKLKEKGFDEECFGFYSKDGEFHYATAIGKLRTNISFEEAGMTEITAPLYQQVVDWFREKHNIFIWLQPTGSWKFTLHFRYEDKNGKHWLHTYRENKEIKMFDTTNQAYNQAIEEALKLI